MSATVMDAPGSTYTLPREACVKDAVLPEHVEFFREKGFLVYENAYTPEEIDELRRDTTRMCRGGYGNIRGRDENVERSGEMASLSDEEVLKRFLCIHFPHKMSPLMFAAILCLAIMGGVLYGTIRRLQQAWVFWA